MPPLAEEREHTSNEHDRASRHVLLTRIAGLLSVPLLPAVEAAQAADRAVFLVPGDTIEVTPGHGLGALSPSRILGGILPAMFVGTKAIAHGLVDPAAACPPEWSHWMAEETSDCVLRGYTAFTRNDAFRAGRLLLTHGPARLKDVCGKAGLSQAVVRNEAELAAALALEDPDSLARCGLVLEQDLVDVITYSVGSAQLRGERISYWGQQNLTKD
ncbi:DUF3182 family protein [Roseomonas populi]|uniref:DUF3182 family protein n=1 Tax=Roseomonas populi TaxID=3121582 RepID=A0ABT1XA82_9PROT|nr:DUF3182 family protein [Roseomonas pecuniae]MCR0985027.1 DUF3182 family protein [Roseomonas pecuniae]